MTVAWMDRGPVWSRIRPLLQRLVEHETRHGMTVDTLTKRIASGQYQVWILNDIEALFLTTIYEQQNGRLVCSLSWAAGDNAIRPDVVLPAIEAYARDHDCYAVEIMGRKGWERVVRNYGYAPFYVGVIKEL